ncbi:hypothetical protein ONE63_002662 [Megalurothrips usitatus]|uniref:Fatty acid desaturase domain-containing protein n=1 Tax=Megalurothrips usitatus TaxID=439358 RepID=A0AAV7X8U6_9NEOP|nr:hypothetical protein ONE63_002662 [Megalurothrips usitatus]
MAPNVTSTTTLFLAEAAPAAAAASPTATATATVTAADAKEDPYAWKIVWRNVLAFVYLHYASVVGFYLMFTGQPMLKTYLFTLLLAVCNAEGITAGAHRLWAHRAYKAKWPLRTLLMLFQTLAFQNHIHEWVRDHRVHHKFTDTDADPHNAKRGFFFSHMGWLMVRKHPDVRTRGATVDLSDLERDPIVMFQKKFYPVLMPLIAFVLPAYLPTVLWGESGWTAWYVCSMARYTLALHGTWLVNSAAHIWGTKPVDKNISPTENSFVGHVAFGEGWHNYHHVFPWDYKAAELGNYNGNLTTAFIDFFAWIGWAYDLKTVSREMIEKRVRRTGDHGDEVWGWGDKDMSQDDVLDATIVNKSD